MAACSAGPAVLLGLRDAAIPASGAGSAQAPAWATNKLGGAPEQQERLAARDWCDEADDWGACDEFEPPDLNPSHLLGVNEASNSCLPKEAVCASQLQRLSLAEDDPFCIHLPAGEERVMSSSVPVFKPYYIAVVDEEDYTGYVDTDHAHKLLKEYQQREGINLEELMSESFAGEGDCEKYEKSKLRSRDQVFHKFMKRISACPEQILRYSWGGEPLFITYPPSDISRRVPACNNCGSNRVFEFQLMPALVSMLESDADVSIEFGTVLVYTCERSCWSVNQKNPLEEFIFIQEDPDQQLFK
ncbi:programmed cell death protein 2-like [Alligator sinensis]|uniref:Programmed cell death protein 2-like n=1 Tax=Alligator sinensis TaxID=38654 RepID=A0A1U7RRW1_ALLSI|nr:programmed cell death protein 2-like [Alligator sinensis]